MKSRQKTHKIGSNLSLRIKYKYYNQMRVRIALTVIDPFQFVSSPINLLAGKEITLAKRRCPHAPLMWRPLETRICEHP